MTRHRIKACGTTRGAYPYAARRARRVQQFILIDAAGTLVRCDGQDRDIFNSLEQKRASAQTPLPMPVLAISGYLGLGEAIIATARKIADHVEMR